MLANMLRHVKNIKGTRVGILGADLAGRPSEQNGGSVEDWDRGRLLPVGSNAGTTRIAKRFPRFVKHKKEGKDSC
ncbi:hypothetical protein EFR84_15285 [Rhizobium chutanense]|uniref:Uncharacterized protein n=1 Tax=Rhizobium chutanense TaxID=2035448 RepID=A0A3S0SGV2_9HYPH|nr:hypothetical protein EFR84_15285 [Rhizobium chutanense]